MSSENPVKKAAIKLGEQEFRKAFGAGGGSSAGAGAPAPGLGAVANEGASSAADLARQVAGIMLRAAIGIGEQVVDAAGKLESVVGDQPALARTDVRSGATTLLTARGWGPVNRPVVAPEGDRIVFLGQSSGRPLNAFRVPPAGGAPTDLQPDPVDQYLDLDWR